MRADELRYSMVGHLWNEVMGRLADELASHDARKSGEWAYLHTTVQGPDGRWVRYTGSPIGTTNMALWIGGLTEKPGDIQEGEFDLSITSLDELLLD